MLAALVIEEYPLHDWQITLGFILETSITPDDALELMERLHEYGAVATLTPDGKRLEVALSITNTSATQGLQEALRIMQHDPITTAATITSIEVINEQDVAHNLTKPVYPEVVGYAEIARMTGVSRQRARMFPHSPGFPTPVIETAQGPLYLKTAIEAWAQRRNTKPGTRTKSFTA